MIIDDVMDAMGAARGLPWGVLRTTCLLQRAATDALRAPYALPPGGFLRWVNPLPPTWRRDIQTPPPPPIYLPPRVSIAEWYARTARPW